LAILLIPGFAVIGAAIGATIAALWLGVDMLFGMSTITPDKAKGLMLIGAAVFEIVCWFLILRDEEW
jgi:hypothetical protein